MRPLRALCLLTALALTGAAPRLASADHIGADEPLPLKEFTPEEIEEIDTFVLGNTTFALYHEIGHMLVAELDLPVAGREEDAVDRLAALFMIPDEPDAVGDALVLAAAEGFLLADGAAGTEMETAAFAADHGFDLQRHYQLLCLVYGSDPEGFLDHAVGGGLPEDRLAACPSEFTKVRSGWLKLLSAHLLKEDEESERAIRVSYGPAKGDMAEVAARLEEVGVLEAVAESVSSSLRLPRPITLRAESCGEGNAWWDPETRQITLCYELPLFYAALIVNHVAHRDLAEDATASR